MRPNRSASCSAPVGRPSAPTSTRPGRRRPSWSGTPACSTTSSSSASTRPTISTPWRTSAAPSDLFPHMTAMMKIEQEPRTYLAIRAIGSGIQNVLFADPRTVADVRGVRQGGAGGDAGHRRHPRRRHAPRRRLRARRGLARLRAGARRRGGRADDREGPRGREPGGAARPSRAWTWCSSAPPTTP